jgi:hypothetical protein
MLCFAQVGRLASTFDIAGLYAEQELHLDCFGLRRYAPRNDAETHFLDIFFLLMLRREKCYENGKINQK